MGCHESCIPLGSQRVELEHQRQRLELVLASSELGVWDWNMLTGETVFDERWAQIVGYRLEELEPISFDTWSTMVHPDDLAVATGLIDDHVNGRTPFYETQFRMRHRDGRWITVRARGKIVERVPDGTPLRMTGTHEDISPRVEAEAALRESQAHFEQAARLAHVGSWTLDLATNHVTWSRELYLMQGLEPEQSPPDYTEHSRLFTAESWQELNTVLDHTRTTGEPYELELEMVRPDGSHGWMLARGEAVRDTNGAIVRLQGVAQDITQRKVAGDELRALATHDTS